MLTKLFLFVNRKILLQRFRAIPLTLLQTFQVIIPSYIQTSLFRTTTYSDSWLIFMGKTFAKIEVAWRKVYLCLLASFTIFFFLTNSLNMNKILYVRVSNKNVKKKSTAQFFQERHLLTCSQLKDVRDTIPTDPH